MKTGILVVAYESEGCIKQLLDRIPETIVGVPPTILVSDDASTDGTADVAEQWAADRPERAVTVIRQPVNLGYGGNQKYCFEWAAAEGADYSVLLHGDEQYPPERIEDLVSPLAAGEADGVYGSRMMTRGGARAGGMPLNRYLGNLALSRLFNRLAGTDFTEWFSGFRAYRTDTLAALDLEGLPGGFDFDAAITLELVEAGFRLSEVPIPTRYGDELSRVPLLRTAFADIGHALALRRARRRGVGARG